MRCPNCDSKIEKGLPSCSKCGTKVADIQNASYTKALEVLKHGTLEEKEQVFHTYNTPKELSRKKLLLLTIFCGLFGGQDFYVGKTFMAVSKIASLTVGMIFILLYYLAISTQFYTLGGLLMAYPLLTWIYDIARVATKRYPFPVIIDN